MKALVLCGGFARRMWPLTQQQPKALLPVKGRPLLEYVLRKIEPLEEVGQIYLSINRRFEPQFTSFLQHYRSRKFVKLVVEPAASEEEKLGAVRGIEFCVDQESIQEPLLVINGDNLFDTGLFGVMLAYKRNRSPVVGLYDVKDPALAKNYGIVSLDGSGRVAAFEEKPAEPAGTLASTGIYIFTVPALEKIPLFLRRHGGDRMGDFVRWLAEQEPVYGVALQGKWFDIGSLEEYERAQREWE